MAVLTDKRVSLRQGSQLHVPLCFQRRSNESIVGIDAKKTPPGQLRFVSGAIYLEPAQSIGFIPPRLHLLLNAEGDLQRKRSNGLHQHRSDSEVQTVSGYSLTVALLDPIYLSWTRTNIVRSQSRFALAIANGHAAAADSADDQPLQ